VIESVGEKGKKDRQSKVVMFHTEHFLLYTLNLLPYHIHLRNTIVRDTAYHFPISMPALTRDILMRRTINALCDA